MPSLPCARVATPTPSNRPSGGQTRSIDWLLISLLCIYLRIIKLLFAIATVLYVGNYFQVGLSLFTLTIPTPNQPPMTMLEFPGSPAWAVPDWPLFSHGCLIFLPVVEVTQSSHCWDSQFLPNKETCWLGSWYWILDS